MDEQRQHTTLTEAMDSRTINNSLLNEDHSFLHSIRTTGLRPVLDDPFALAPTVHEQPKPGAVYRPKGSAYILAAVCALILFFSSACLELAFLFIATDAGTAPWITAVFVADIALAFLVAALTFFAIIVPAASFWPAGLRRLFAFVTGASRTPPLVVFHYNRTTRTIMALLAGLSSAGVTLGLAVTLVILFDGEGYGLLSGFALVGGLIAALLIGGMVYGTVTRVPTRPGRVPDGWGEE